MTASVTGAKVFFTDRERLTPDSTAGGIRAHQDLYLFNVETNKLEDITVDTADADGASVIGVLGASEDGSYIYFVATGALSDTHAVMGHDNLYMWHEGTISFIGPLSSDDSGHSGFHEPVVAHDWDTSAGDRTARVTADGRHLLFMSDARLTSYDNRDAETGEPDEEVYLYDAPSGSLSCVSCNPSGARPVGSSGFPGGTPLRTADELGTYQPRVLSEDGSRVFFDSRDALVAQDTNGVQDVYEWEGDGAGTCSRSEGCVFLLSGAASTSAASFVDASADGDDVFFVTRAELVAQDTDQLRDLYDARIPHVPGEEVAFPPPIVTQPCEGEACLPSALAVTQDGALGSATFDGVGNLSSVSSKPAARVKTKKRSKSKRHKHIKQRGHKVQARKSIVEPRTR